VLRTSIVLAQLGRSMRTPQIEDGLAVRRDHVYMSGTMVVRVDHHPEAGDPLNSGHYNRTQALRLMPVDSMDRRNHCRQGGPLQSLPLAAGTATVFRSSGLIAGALYDLTRRNAAYSARMSANQQDGIM